MSASNLNNLKCITTSRQSHHQRKLSKKRSKFKRNSDCHLASEELFSSVAVDMGAEEDASGEGFATVGANMG